MYDGTIFYYSIPGQERWKGGSESDQYPEEPVIVVHYYTIPPISFPTQWQAEEDIFNGLVSFDFSHFKKELEEDLCSISFWFI